MLGLRFNPYPPPQPIHNLPAHSQSNSGALELLLSVQPLKKDEYPFEILRLNPQAIVPHGKDPFLARLIRCRDVYYEGLQHRGI